MRLPELVVEQNHRWGAGVGIRRRETAAQHRLHTEELHRVGGKGAPVERLRAAVVQVADVPGGVGGDIFKVSRVAAKGGNLIKREHCAVFGLVVFRITDKNTHLARRGAIRERTEYAVVDHAEHCGRKANAQRERRNSHH